MTSPKTNATLSVAVQRTQVNFTSELPLGVFEFIVVLVIGSTIAKAVARRISSPTHAGNAHLREHLEITEQRLEETEQRLAENTDRLAELEERLDFTERMLARQNAREQLNS